ncbi:MAG: DUF4115 domain-containing protein [Rhodocyclaceae bacterium]|nr:DUF4115 domain-containing protein [Rhodocyclaceae bacterium]
MSEANETSQAGGANEAAAQPTVGAQLRAAREAAHLTLADVAQALKFSPRQIEALEADDHAALPGNTIVRGFVRSYGKLLKLAAEQLLRQIDAVTPSAVADVRPPDNMGVASEEAGLRQMSPLVATAIVIALAALLLALWHFFGPGAKPPAGAGREAALSPAVVPQTVPAPAEPAAPLQPAAGSPAMAAPAPPSAESGAAPASPAAASLHFVFEGRSWLEVTDASQKVITTGENPAGSQLTVNGKPPFDIVIGNAPKVKLSYGERVIDLAPYTRADVARFRLE